MDYGETWVYQLQWHAVGDGVCRHQRPSTGMWATCMIKAMDATMLPSLAGC
jgi:hypothetical protein